MNTLLEFQNYLKEVLHEARDHCCDLNENDINVAGVTIDIKTLSDFLNKFLTNLDKIVEYQLENDNLDHILCGEIQNFIQYKTKILKDLIPYKESTVNHADWWGKTFKQITQNIVHN